MRRDEQGILNSPHQPVHVVGDARQRCPATELPLSLAFLSYRTPHESVLSASNTYKMSLCQCKARSPRGRDVTVVWIWDEMDQAALTELKTPKSRCLENQARLAIAHKWQNYWEVFARVPVRRCATVPCAIFKLPSLLRCSNIFSPSASQGIRKLPRHRPCH